MGWTRSLGENNSVWTEDRVRQQSGPAPSSGLNIIMSELGGALLCDCRVMAVCPWVVDTALVRAGLANIGPEERKRKEQS